MRHRVSGEQRADRPRIASLGLIILWTIAACGGGGGGAPAAPPLATATSTPTVTTTPTTNVPTATASPSATLTATASPSPIPTQSPTPTATTVPTYTRTAEPTHTLVPTLTVTATSIPTHTVPPVPTTTPSATPLTGPIIPAVGFGLADVTGSYTDPVGTDDHGRPVFTKSAGNSFIIFVEGRPGPSRFPLGTNLFNSRSGDPTQQPDLQIESDRDLGNGTSLVCDNSLPTPGGIPRVPNPPDFGFVQAISDALNDFSCRFKVYAETDFACTQDPSSGDFSFRDRNSTIQFCTLVSDALTFLDGDTVLTARLRDTAGNTGPPAAIVVRVSGGN
jgi:hypothetical protein